MLNFSELNIQAAHFLDKVFTQLESKNVDLKNWEIDHLCYRTSSKENYEQSKKTFEKLGTLLIESEVNGRLIATYKLEKPLFYKKWMIELVEVPAPKPHKETAEGFEHIEVVIDDSFHHFMELYPKIPFDLSGLQKDLNPELEIEFENCAVKFHHKSLGQIIHIEKNSALIEFLEKSKVLSLLKQYRPCISGTLPLGIENPNSDLDLLFEAKNLEDFIRDARNCFKHYENFSVRTTTHQERKTVIINFQHEGLPIELFCQSHDVLKQQANQHFLIEGRLLKILGHSFKEKVISLKHSGLKTEPAFGKLLGLTDPYKELLELNKLSDLELYEKFY